jgi:hypothetical protein
MVPQPRARRNGRLKTCLPRRCVEAPGVVLELSHRAQRVRFKHPVRVIPLDGSPRIYRTLSANLSRKGMFVRMPEPLPLGTRVALSLEVKGQALPFAEAEIAWCRNTQSQLPGRFVGFGVRFTSFLNPRAPELVDFLVKNLDRGRPLTLVPPREARRRRLLGIGLGAVAAAGLLWAAVGALLQAPQPDEALAVEVATVPDGADELLAEPDEALGREAAVAEADGPVVAAGPSAPEEASLAPAPAAEPDARGAGPETPAPAPPASGAAVMAAGPVQGAARGLVATASRATASDEAQRPEPPQSAPRRERSAQKARGSTGQVWLPSGAASALTWSLEGESVRVGVGLTPGATVSRRFLLDGPPRLVLDLDGRAPVKSQTVRADAPWLKRVRIGRHGTTTRLVIDLTRAPVDLQPTEQGVALSFAR